MHRLIYSKSQTAIEFMILIAFVMFAFSVFLLVIYENMSVKIGEQRNTIIKDTALAIQDEINLAAHSSEGYYREFEIPEKIGGVNYSAEILEEMVYLKTIDGKHALALPVPKITGQIVKGKNIIKKENGETKLNE